MEINKGIIIIQCRYDSKRAPGKILRKFNDGKSCLEHLVGRLHDADFNTIIATTYREVDMPIVEVGTKLSQRYPHLLHVFRGSDTNIAQRLYAASSGYDYVIRVTGDDIFVDVDLLNMMARYAMEKKLDYLYAHDLIRGCDCDIYKRDALLRVQDTYKTNDVESIEFLMKNGKFLSESFDVPVSFKRQDISLTIDTEDDWKLASLVYDKLSKINPYFSTWDICMFFADNHHLTNINKRPLVTVYTVFKNYPLEWLQQAIESLSHQTFTDYEYILLDYGSHTLHTYVKSVNNEEKYRVLLTDDMTFVEAIQFILKKAQGKYIIRLDADDILYPLALERMVTYLQQNPFYSAVIANHHRYSKDMSEMIQANYDGEIDNVMSCALIEKKKYNFVDFLEKQAFRDGTNLLKAFSHYDMVIGYLKEPLFRYRIHDESLTHGTGKEALISEMDMIIKGTK